MRMWKKVHTKARMFTMQEMKLPHTKYTEKVLYINPTAQLRVGDICFNEDPSTVYAIKETKITCEEHDSK
jgi:hypothetical protein